MTPFVFVLLALATWRLSHMLVVEYGPFGLFMWIRELFGIKHVHKLPNRGTIMSWSPTNPLYCVTCTSVWIALIVLLCYTQWEVQTLTFVYLLAMSSVASVIHFVIDALGEKK